MLFIILIFHIFRNLLDLNLLMINLALNWCLDVLFIGLLNISRFKFLLLQRFADMNKSTIFRISATYLTKDTYLLRSTTCFFKSLKIVKAWWLAKVFLKDFLLNNICSSLLINIWLLRIEFSLQFGYHFFVFLYFLFSFQNFIKLKIKPSRC
jgi:hypothetical protein